ncbi:DNA-binding transcriptional regulator, MarR family [Lachnospiraceae bacterium G11]|nr:DNA-binding transcriptional regulator, MarR family [Lachnospiraceae bacterium G11]
MADTYEQLRLKIQLCFPLYACSRKIVNSYTPFLKPLGLTYTQYIVFLVLWEEGSSTVGELGKKLFLDEGTLTPLLKKMADKGYVKRTRLKEDERVTQISLTPEGEALKEKCKDIPYKIAETVTPLNKEDATDLYRILYKILENQDGDKK